MWFYKLLDEKNIGSHLTFYFCYKYKTKKNLVVNINAGAKELYFNSNGEAMKRMSKGVDKLAAVVGVTLGPKGRNVVLESKYVVRGLSTMV
jgi:hypothetical protein